MENKILHVRQLGLASFALGVAALLGSFVALVGAAAPAEKWVEAPNNLRVSVKMVGPATQTTDLQIICVLKHEPSGDEYLDAMKELDDKLGGLLSNLRDRGAFIGEPGETFLFTPPANSITPSRVLLIGGGEGPSLTLDRLRLVGRTAARESVRLNVEHVSFAPTLRDQGSTRIDVADGDAAVAGEFLLACDTEKKLEAEGLAPKDDLKDFTVEAGSKFFDNAVERVTAAVASAAEQIKGRKAAPFHSAVTPHTEPLH